MKRYISIKNIIAIAVITTIIKFWVNAFVFDNGVAWNDPSPSIFLSKVGGLFICPVQALPNELEWKGSRISVKEAWIERELKTEFSYVWLYTPKYSGKYVLCFTLDQGNEVFGRVESPFFIQDGVSDQGMTSSFGRAVLFYCELSPNDISKHTTGFSLIKTWTDSRDRHIEFKW